MARVREQLDHAREDSSVRALLLRINSPGGTVTASDILYQEVLRFKRERGVPVVAHFLGVAASGGYYVAMAADEVIAQPTTVTGSIGVIFIGVNLDRPDAEDRRRGPDAHRGRPEGRRLLAATDAAGGARPPAGGARRHARSLQADRGGGTPAARRWRASRRSPTGASSAPIRPWPTDWSTVSAISKQTVAVAQRRAGLASSRVVIYHRPREYRQNLYTRGAGAAAHAAARAARRRCRCARPGFLYLWAPGRPDAALTRGVQRGRATSHRARAAGRARRGPAGPAVSPEPLGPGSVRFSRTSVRSRSGRSRSPARGTKPSSPSSRGSGTSTSAPCNAAGRRRARSGVPVGRSSTV